MYPKKIVETVMRMGIMTPSKYVTETVHYTSDVEEMIREAIKLRDKHWKKKLKKPQKVDFTKKPKWLKNNKWRQK